MVVSRREDGSVGGQTLHRRPSRREVAREHPLPVAVVQGRRGRIGVEVVKRSRAQLQAPRGASPTTVSVATIVVAAVGAPCARRGGRMQALYFVKWLKIRKRNVIK